MVSILLPCYNRAKYIPECMESLLGQTYKNIEIIAVDDGSNDNTYEILKQYPITVLKHERNMGLGAARNTLLKKAKGEYIQHMDSDDILTPESIEVRIKEMKKNPNLDLVHGTVWAFRGEWLKSSLEPYGPETPSLLGCLWHRRLLDKYGLFYDGILLRTDGEYCFRLGLKSVENATMPISLNVKKIKHACAYVRLHSGNNAKLIKTKKDKKKQAKLFRARIYQLREEGITKENTPFL